MSEKRAVELRPELLAHWRFLVKHIKNDKSVRDEERLDILLHSICSSLDGVSGQFDHVTDLVIEGITINGDVMLHEELYE